MYQVIIFIYHERYYENIMTALTDIGAHTAFVIEGLNMANALAFNVPIFAGLRAELQHSPKFCKIIFTLVDDKESIDELVESIKDSGINNKKEKVFTLTYHKVTKIE